MPRSNVLWICTDQQHFDTLGCYNNEFVETPKIDQLTDSGPRVTHAYAQSPVCTRIERVSSPADTRGRLGVDRTARRSPRYSACSARRAGDYSALDSGTSDTVWYPVFR